MIRELKQEIDYFFIGGSMGWCQAWFSEWWMNKGACAAVTACDLCIVESRKPGLSRISPVNSMHISRRDYHDFAYAMRPYLQPRRFGVNKLEIYISGLTAYWRDRGCYVLHAAGLPGSADLAAARDLVRHQIDNGVIVPCLLLHHENPTFANFQWHWFNLAGYEEGERGFFVKAVTYGLFYWFDLAELWETGFEEKGGLVAIQRAG